MPVRVAQRGFTLFEIVIVILIIGAISAIALPQFQSNIARSRLADAAARFDQVLDKLVRQNMAFAAPTSMQLGARETVELAIGGGLTVEQLRALLRPSGQGGGNTIKATERMAARLIAPGFNVSPLTAEIQEVTGTDPTVWRWRIEPTSAGKQVIHLVIDALSSVGGKDAARSTVLDKTIFVEVDTWDARWAWIKDNWAIVSFALLAAAGIVRFIVARTRPANRPEV